MNKDLIQVMTENHAVLGWLSGRLRLTRSAGKSLLFNEFARALGAHQTLIDQTVIPALKSCGWRGVSSDVLAGHMALKRGLAELLTLRPGSAGFDEALEGLLQGLAAQCALERDKLLPRLRQLLDAGQRRMLGCEAELHLTQILGDESRLDDIDIARPVDELLAEAHVVLASLSGAAAQHRGITTP